MVGAFKDLLTDPGDWHPSMEGLDFNRIGDEEVARLEEVFSEEEVFSALSDLNGDKAVQMVSPLVSGSFAGILSKKRLWVF